MRIFLVEEQGYLDSYSSMERYAQKKKFMQRMASKGYPPLAQPVGHGQVDFGERLYYDRQGRSLKAMR